MTFHFQEYTQNNQDFLIGTMTAEQIIENSQVLIYNNDDGGYQRDPNQLHINKISKYIINEDNFILPTAIILGIDKNLLNFSQTIQNLLRIDIPEGEKFRVVDGQHRIAGLKKSLSHRPDVKDFILPVIIILTDPKKRSIELEIFSDINSKAKRINTDLAQLAKHDYEVLEREIKESEITNHIAIKTAYNLKENKKSIWSNAIKFNIQTEFNLGIIGVSMFSGSITKIVEHFKIKNNFNDNAEKIDIISQCNSIASEVSSFLDYIWTDIIAKKWESAFNESYQLDSLGDSVPTFYNTKYYIQKGIGTKSVNGFISEILDTSSIEECKVKVREYINSSITKSDDWIVGGPFSGYNSESGFKKIKDLLLETNKIQKED